MGKEITLPWNCETSSKMKRVFKWIVLITSPSALFYSFTFNVHNLSLGQFGVMLYGCGSIMIWIIQVMIWNIDDKLPSFKCKPKESR